MLDLRYIFFQMYYVRTEHLLAINHKYTQRSQLLIHNPHPLENSNYYNPETLLCHQDLVESLVCGLNFPLFHYLMGQLCLATLKNDNKNSFFIQCFGQNTNFANKESISKSTLLILHHHCLKCKYFQKIVTC